MERNEPRTRGSTPSNAWRRVHRAAAPCARRVGASIRARQSRTGDAGAILILALVFLVAISLMVIGLLTWVGTSLTATGAFANERGIEYSATDAVNLAISATRYTFDSGSPTPFLNNPTPEQCASYAQPNTTTTITVYCSMLWQPYASETRIFTYSACDNGATPTNCAAQPMLQDIVAFDDYPSGVAAPSPTPTPCTPIVAGGGSPGGGSCGETMTQLSWQWSPTVPAVTSIQTVPVSNPPQGATTGGTTVWIQGTGFTSSSTVNFTEEAQQLPTPQTYDPPAAATVSGTCGANCISVTSPPVISGTVYVVTVTTSGGTSQAIPSTANSFTYSPTVPTLSSVTPNAGQITGNTTVSIQGTGIWNAPNSTFDARVSFCPTGGGSCSPGTVLRVTPPPAGSNLDTMTVVTPNVGATGPYYVQVDVYGQLSPLTSAVEFTYSVQAPLIIALSPSSGGTGSALTLTGANFLQGSTVGLCPWTASPPSNYSQTCTQTAAAITSLSVTQITVTVPSTPAGSYYPIVNLPSSYGTPPSQPYNESGDIFQHT